MKKRSSKTILVFLALGLISCAFCVQQAQGAYIDDPIITLSGGVTLDADSVNDATKVTGWVDPKVDSVSGFFADFVAVNDPITLFPMWSFNSGPITGFWSVGGFTFDLIASRIIGQFGDGFVTVMGTGTITGHGHTVEGTWRFSANDDPANDVFSFSASTVPDGGMTAALLGLGLVAIEGIRRKLIKKQS